MVETRGFVLWVALAAAGLGLSEMRLSSIARDGATQQEALTDTSSEPAWSERLRRVDDALAQGDVTRAGTEWRDAYAAATRARHWIALAEVGDRAARIAEVSATPEPFVAEARKAYLRALFRARAERSADGIRRIADDFARLGDAGMAEQARRLTEELS